MHDWIELYNELHDHDLIRIEAQATLSAPWVYVPTFLIWLYLIIRNNTPKQFAVLACSLAILIGMYVILKQVMPIQLFGLCVVCSFFTFSVALFRSFALAITVLAGLLLALCTGLIPLTGWSDLLISIALGCASYLIYCMINHRFRIPQNYCISDKYTSTGYLKSDLSILNWEIAFTYFICLLVSIWPVL